MTVTVRIGLVNDDVHVNDDDNDDFTLECGR